MAKTLGDLVRENMEKDGFNLEGGFEGELPPPPEKNLKLKEKKVEVEETTEDVATPELEQKVEEVEVEPVVVEPEVEVEAEETVEVSEPKQEEVIIDDTLEGLKKLTPEELAEKKAQFDKYNTQKAQENAAFAKKLQQQQDDLIAAEGRMKEMYDQMYEKAESSKDIVPDEPELEMLNRELGTNFDELSDSNDIVMAKHFLEQKKFKAKEVEQKKLDNEEYEKKLVEKSIAQLDVDWTKLKKEKGVSDSEEVAEAIFSILLARRRQTPNFTVEQAYNTYVNSIPYTRDKEAFLKFAMENEWSADLTAAVLEKAKVRRNKAGNIPIVKTGVISTKKEKPKQGYGGSLKEVTKAALEDIKVHF